MSPTRPAEPDVVPDARLVRRLLRAQAPDLGWLPVGEEQTSGSSNRMFRLGERHAVRLPRTDAYAADLVKEVRWGPYLAPRLPVAVPEVVVEGRPSPLFDRPWTVVAWLAGETPTALDEAQQCRLAEDLGGFLGDLHAIDTLGQPAGAERWGYRCGEPVTPTIDRWAAEAAAELDDLFDPTAVAVAWHRLRVVPEATAPPCWVHTDLSSENLLVGSDGGLVGVLDLGGLGIGDRSVDLLYAWSLFAAPARDVLRRAAGVDDATWLRARAWAFVGPGLLTLADYRHTLPGRTARLTSMVEAVAAEVGVHLR